MIILGVDPGIATTGYGLIDFDGNKFRAIDYGPIYTEPKHSLPERLAIINRELTDVIVKYKPDAFSVEELFFNKNVKTALNVGHARGVILFTAYSQGLSIFEYTPLQVKQAVAGYGRADKKQIQQMTRILLNLDDIPKPDDVADALAIALCHANSCSAAELFRIR